ncbi:hypothetical protein V8D89_000336 [Ganoderma adspersum]
MRVLDTVTGQFVEIDPKDEDIKYSILSHAWTRSRRRGEQTHQQLRDIQRSHTRSRADEYQFDGNSSESESSDIDSTSSGGPLSPIWDDPKLSPKIREACRVARENGYRYLWIDSCCIDKTSSSELSESINSMYQWYALADVCYAFLSDVPAEEDHWAEDSLFRACRWFTRGWTLQELIAPLFVMFLAQDWAAIGSKDDLAELVMEITNIDYNALLHIEPLDKFSVAQRFSWAANRETTRVEDRAYSLLGIFDINMPTLYGEGERAFRRLQEEIMRRTPDQSLFAWTQEGLPDPSSHLHDPEATDAHKDRTISFCKAHRSPSLLAPSLDFFSKCAGIEALSHEEVIRRLRIPANGLLATDYHFTPYGIRVEVIKIPLLFPHYFPVERVDGRWIPRILLSSDNWYLIILGCGHRDFPGHLLGHVCYTTSLGSDITFLHSGVITINSSTFNLLPVSPATIERLHSSHILSDFKLETRYIPQPSRDEGVNGVACWKPHETINLMLLKKTRDALSAQGYTATLRGPDDIDPATIPYDDNHPTTTHSVTLSHDTHTITIFYQHTLEEGATGQVLTIKACVETSQKPTLQDTSGNRPGYQFVTREWDNKKQVSWTDGALWPRYEEAVNYREVAVYIPGPTSSLEVKLRLALAFTTRNHYRLHIELETATTRYSPRTKLEY